jgi:hypothetical protein
MPGRSPDKPYQECGEGAATCHRQPLHWRAHLVDSILIQDMVLPQRG